MMAVDGSDVGWRDFSNDPPAVRGLAAVGSGDDLDGDDVDPVCSSQAVIDRDSGNVLSPVTFS